SLPWRDGGPVSLFDLVLVALLVCLAVGGYRLGFVARMLSWVGLAIGVAVAAWAAPKVLDTVPGLLGIEGDLDSASRLVMVGGAFVVIASLGAAVGAAVGARLRMFIPGGAARQLDRAAGALAGALGALVLIWLFLPAISEVPGTISRQARNSAIARAIDGAVPRPPKSLQALRQAVRDANFPQVFDELGPSPRTGVPPPPDVLDPAVQARVKGSTVRVSGVACGRLMEGSGFAGGPEIIVTNAHVVAGEASSQVLRPDGKRLSARVVVFDPQRDLAVLSVPGLNQAALPVATANVGDKGAVFGHPEGQIEVDVQPARVDGRRTATGRDIYNSESTRRDVLFLASRLAPGDSGGALVNESGAVMGVAFAIAPDEPSTAYAISDRELRPVLAQPRNGPVSTGPCVG
ncbi:MAG: MarP family serine protease, partial [Actinomycetota bacterium]|nr:MarP family serine protease [Actinomycetota bacterium]